MSLELAGICGREARLGLQLACWDRVGLGSEEGLASRGSVPPPMGTTAKVAYMGPPHGAHLLPEGVLPLARPPPHPLAQVPPLGPSHPSCDFWGEAEGVKLALGGRAWCFPWFVSAFCKAVAVERK